MPPWSIGYHPNEFNWIYSHFEQYFLPGRISNLTGHEILLKMGRNSWIYTLVELGIIPMNSTGFTPNSIGQEILLKMGRNSWIYTLVELGIIPMNSTGFTPILSSISCPVEFDRSNFKFDRA